MEKSISERLATLSVAHVADGCLRAGSSMRVVADLQPVLPGQRASGRARPVRHHGSVDVFLEALADAGVGDVLVIDNGDRIDEGCIGDLTTLEVAQAGLSGIVIWGRHRDTAIVRKIPIALFSRGACARGPVRLDARGADTFASARLGNELANRSDWVVADDDGVILIDDRAIDAVVTAAESIRDNETLQTERMNAGATLRTQLRFAEYLEARAADSSVDFRTYLRALDAAIEE